MEKDEVNIYLDQLYYSAEGEELAFITNFIDGVIEDAKHLDKVNIDNVLPADWPFDLEVSYLREDEVKDLLSCEQVLENASQTQENYVKYIKVV